MGKTGSYTYYQYSRDIPILLVWVWSIAPNSDRYNTWTIDRLMTPFKGFEPTHREQDMSLPSMNGVEGTIKRMVVFTHKCGGQHIFGETERALLHVKDHSMY